MNVAVYAEIPPEDGHHFFVKAIKCKTLQKLMVEDTPINFYDDECPYCDGCTDMQDDRFKGFAVTNLYCVTAEEHYHRKCATCRGCDFYVRPVHWVQFPKGIHVCMKEQKGKGGAMEDLTPCELFLMDGKPYEGTRPWCPKNYEFNGEMTLCREYPNNWKYWVKRPHCEANCSHRSQIK